MNDSSFSVGRGEIVGLIGPNGAGKTTTLLALMNLLSATGAVRYRGRDTRGRTPEALVGKGLVLVPKKRELFASLSVEDNLRLEAFARRRCAATWRGVRPLPPLT